MMGHPPSRFPRGEPREAPHAFQATRALGRRKLVFTLQVFVEAGLREGRVQQDDVLLKEIPPFMERARLGKIPDGLSRLSAFKGVHPELDER
jgi:hypothetical protein